jgi:hypothetical protein
MFIRSLSTLGRCSVNLNSPTAKIGTLEIGPKTQNGNFLKIVLTNDFDEVSVTYGRLCGLVGRVPATDPKIPGSIPGATRFYEK